MHWDFPEISPLGLGFGQNIRLANGIWAKLRLGIGIYTLPSNPPQFRTLFLILSKQDSSHCGQKFCG